MLRINAKVLASPIHGLGLFAEEAIPKGTVIWKFDQGFDLIIDIRDVPAHEKQIRRFLTWYGYQTALEEPIYVVCMDHARFMNHDENCNTIERKSMTVAKRNIAAGEEITCNYKLFDKRYRKRESF